MTAASIDELTPWARSLPRPVDDQPWSRLFEARAAARAGAPAGVCAGDSRAKGVL